MFAFVFVRLLLAHLMADFLFQTNGVYRIKVKYAWGVLLHGSIAGVLSALFVLPYLQNSGFAAFIILLWFLHIIQDKGKIAYNVHVERNNLWTFLGDQLLHMFVIAVASFGTIKLPQARYPGPDIVDKLYTNSNLIVFACWVVVLSYGMLILQEYIKKTIRHDVNEGMVVPPAFQKYFGIIIRLMVGVSFFFGGWWYVLTVVAAGGGAFAVSKDKIESLDYRITLISALVIGLLMKLTVSIGGLLG